MVSLVCLVGVAVMTASGIPLVKEEVCDEGLIVLSG
jgi:hypothetical protein